jgi:hypothetical protein
MRYLMSADMVIRNVLVVLVLMLAGCVKPEQGGVVPTAADPSSASLGVGPLRPPVRLGLPVSISGDQARELIAKNAVAEWCGSGLLKPYIHGEVC